MFISPTCRRDFVESAAVLSLKMSEQTQSGSEVTFVRSEVVQIGEESVSLLEGLRSL